MIKCAIFSQEYYVCDVCCDMLYMYDVTSRESTWILDMRNSVLCNTT